jgi:hypothetical protein
MKRLVLTLFLLAFALGVNAFWGGVNKQSSSSLMPSINIDSFNRCARTYHIIDVLDGNGTYDFYVLKKDPLDPSKWIIDQGPLVGPKNQGKHQAIK